MKVFLTGATGFIGQALVRAMRRRSWDVRALVRDVNGAPARWLTEKGVQLARGDVTQPEGLRQAIAGSDVVLHNAGVYEFGSDAALRARMEAVNVQGTANVLGAALEAGVPRTSYGSTGWALGPPGPRRGEGRDPAALRRVPHALREDQGRGAPGRAGDARPRTAAGHRNAQRSVGGQRPLRLRLPAAALPAPRDATAGLVSRRR